MLRTLKEKVSNTQGQMDNVSREIENLGKNKKMLQIENILRDMKTVFDGHGCGKNL